MGITVGSRIRDWWWLEAQGFVGCDGGSVYQYNGVSLKPARQWCVFQTGPRQCPGKHAGSLGDPGLWRPGTDDPEVREFHLPLAPLLPGGIDEDGLDTLRACVDWALCTRSGTVPDGWVCPPRETIQSYIPDGSLTVQSGPLVRQGELITAADRLTLRYTIVPTVPAALEESRSIWLDRLIAAAHRHWRLVRVGWAGAPDCRSILAEVDLSGAPHQALDRLIPIGADALHWIAEWLLLPANVVADLTVPCGLFDSMWESEP